MQVTDLSYLLLALEVAIHQTHWKEECLVVAFEIG